jgi:hypothetical protein
MLHKTKLLIGAIAVLVFMAAITVLVLVINRPPRNSNVTADSERQQLIGTLEERIAAAKGALQGGLESNRDSKDPYIRDHLVPAFERGIDVLSTQPPPKLRDPVLLLAAFERAEPSGYRLFLLWLEDGFSTSGIAVVEGDNKVLTEESVFEFSGEDRRRLGPTVWRPTAVRVLLGEVATTKEAATQPGSWPPIRLPADAFRRQLKVSLITRDGKRTEALRAYVDPALKTN